MSRTDYYADKVEKTCEEKLKEARALIKEASQYIGFFNADSVNGQHLVKDCDTFLEETK